MEVTFDALHYTIRDVAKAWGPNAARTAAAERGKSRYADEYGKLGARIVGDECIVAWAGKRCAIEARWTLSRAQYIDGAPTASSVSLDPVTIDAATLKATKGEPGGARIVRDALVVCVAPLTRVFSDQMATLTRLARAAARALHVSVEHDAHVWAYVGETTDGHVVWTWGANLLLNTDDLRVRAIVMR